MFYFMIIIGIVRANVAKQIKMAASLSLIEKGLMTDVVSSVCNYDVTL